MRVSKINPLTGEVENTRHGQLLHNYSMPTFIRLEIYLYPLLRTSLFKGLGKTKYYHKSKVI